MDPAAIVNHRLRTQRLVGGPFPSPAAAVEAPGAVQAAHLGIPARLELTEGEPVAAA